MILYMILYKGEETTMSTLEKKLLALAEGKDLPWNKIVALLKAYGVLVQPPRGGGSHSKLICEGHVTIVVPVHNGKVKRIYARKIAELLADLAQ